MRIELPDGQWAELRDRVSHREAKDFMRQVMAASEAAGSPFEGGMAIRDVTVGWFVTGWSYEMPLPAGNPEGFDDLDSAAADVLIEAAVAQQERLIPSFGGKKESTAPTSPSSD
jgi:hypothetical protein